jgi:hypothetical protein
MGWLIFIIGIVGFIIYNFLHDKDQMLKHQVDMRGGMAKKYEFLISKLTEGTTAKVVKVTRDHIHIRAVGNTTATNFFITENFNKTEIEWIGQLGMLGKHKHRWTFPHNFPQEKMLNEIGEYLEWKTKQMFE